MLAPLALLAPGRWRQILRSPAALYLATQILGRVGSLLVLPLYARRLTIEQLGHVALAQTLVVALVPLLSLGLGTSVVRIFFDGTDRAAGARLAGGLLRWISLQLSGLGTLAAVIAAIFTPPAAGAHGGFVDRQYLFTVLIAAAGSALMASTMNYYRAAQQLRVVMILNVLELVQTTLLPLLFVQVLQQGYAGALAAISWGGLFTFVLANLLVWVALRGLPTRKLVIEGLRFGWPMFVQFYANWLAVHADRWFLQFNGLSADVGRYSVGRQLTSPIQMVSTALADAEYPRVGERYREGGMAAIAKDLPAMRRRLLLFTVPLLIALVCALPLLYRIVGGQAAAGVLLAPVLALGLVIEYQSYPYIWILYFARKAEVLKWNAIATVVTTVLGGFTLVPLFGVPGALVTQGLVTVVRLLIVRWAAHRVLATAPEGQPPAGESVPS